MKIYYNGYIVQRVNDRSYKGIEGDNWYLNYESSDDYFEKYYNENIAEEWNDEKIECCNDIAYIQRYISESKKLGINYRILLCCTQKEMPQLNTDKLLENCKFLGYDYAYMGGSYYSAVFSDIFTDRIQEFKHIVLNVNGLIDDLEELESFIKLREKMLETDDEYVLERGDFVIYKLYEVKDMHMS